MRNDDASDSADPADIAHALAVIRKALETASSAGSSPAKTALLRDLAQDLPPLTKLANDLRREEMERIYESQSLSLAALGKQFRISRQRAEQLVKNNRSGKGRRNDSNA